MKERGVAKLTIVGLATDFCEKHSALDSVMEGFRTTVDLSGCRGIGFAPSDIEKAIDEMRKAGVIIKGQRETGDSVQCCFKKFKTV